MNQGDCIECMTVCRRWQKLIPQHGMDVWKELKISGTSWSRSKIPMSECLGTNGKKITIISHQNSNQILQQRKREECNIEFLGK